jgi:hypothetical protein
VIFITGRGGSTPLTHFTAAESGLADNFDG